MDIPKVEKIHDGKIHDVFLSFRGEDTRSGFTSHLYAALSRVGIQTFIDDGLQRGEEISESLFRAIELSRISVVIFSPNYANSRWCLNELVKISECIQTARLWIVPIFYHVDPSDVRCLRGRFGEAFTELINRISATQDVVQRWRDALSLISNFSGWQAGIYENESYLIKLIVEQVSCQIDNGSLFIADYPVGLGPRVQKVMSELQSHAESNTVFILGIWGMGGIGKTTIAKALFNVLCWNFNRRSFIANIREAWKYRNGQDLQEQLIYDILGETHLKIHSTHIGKNVIKRRLHQIRALVLLDDVNDEDQLKALCGNHNWFAPSSIIIITSRDRALLDKLEADYVFKMDEMENSQSLELFSWHAFKLPSPPKDFIELSSNIVGYCGGLPLALEVLGSFLFNKRSIPEWEDVLSKLEKIPNGKVHDKLKISFDGLNDQTEKDIFLDICCFFIGKNKNYVSTILNGCGLHAEIGITVLIERSLVRINRNDKLEMHDLLRDMGREIIREKSPGKLEERCRLWYHEDALDVLGRNSGTVHVKGLALRLPRTNKICFPTESFKQMNRLRLLQLSHVELAGNYDGLLEDLRWICWLEFPMRYPPRNFYKERLVAIDFRHSNLELFWKVPQFLNELKILNLSHSCYLTETPDFSYMPNLERLVLKHCPSLSKVHETIGNLNRLHSVNFKGCKCLRHLPKGFYTLNSLENINLSDSNIEKLEEDIEQMESLKTLVADKTAIIKIPFSIVRLKSIKYISLCGYKGSPHHVFPSLFWSWMSPSNILQSLTQAFMSISSPLFSGMKNNLNDTGYFIPERTQSTSLISDKDDSTLVVSDNQAGISRSENSVSSLLIHMGEQSIIQGLTTDQPRGSFFPFDKHPNWPTYSNEGQGICFEVPYVGCNLERMILCIDYSCSQDNMTSPFPFSILIQNNTKGIIQLYKRDSITSAYDESQWQGIVSNLIPGDKVEVIVVFGQRFIVKKTTIHLIYGQSIHNELECLSTSKRDVDISIDTSNGYGKLTGVNPKRLRLDDDDKEEGAPFKLAKKTMI